MASSSPTSRSLASESAATESSSPQQRTPAVLEAVSGLGSTLLCFLCRNLLTDPSTLPVCGHHFCNDCLEDYSERAKDWVCPRPDCRTPFTSVRIGINKPLQTLVNEFIMLRQSLVPDDSGLVQLRKREARPEPRIIGPRKAQRNKEKDSKKANQKSKSPASTKAKSTKRGKKADAEPTQDQGDADEDGDDGRRDSPIIDDEVDQKFLINDNDERQRDNILDIHSTALLPVIRRAVNSRKRALSSASASGDATAILRAAMIGNNPLFASAVPSIRDINHLITETTSTDGPSHTVDARPDGTHSDSNGNESLASTTRALHFTEMNDEQPVSAGAASPELAPSPTISEMDVDISPIAFTANDSIHSANVDLSASQLHLAHARDMAELDRQAQKIEQFESNLSGHRTDHRQLYNASARNDSGNVANNEDELPRLEPPSASLVPTNTVRVTVSQFNTLGAEKLPIIEIIRNIGGHFSKNFQSSVTHIVTPVHEDDRRLTKRTLKYMLALLHGLWIVDISWIRRSKELGFFISEADHEVLGDTIVGQCEAPRRAREDARRRGINNACQLLRGYRLSVVLPMTIRDPPISDLLTLIDASGATRGKVFTLDVDDPDSFFTDTDSDADSDTDNQHVFLCSFDLKLERSPSFTAFLSACPDHCLMLPWLLDSITAFQPKPMQQFLIDR